MAGAKRRIELPAVAVTVPAGQQLFLAVTPFAEMFGAHASRVPGVMTLADAKVQVPVLSGRSRAAGRARSTSRASRSPRPVSGSAPPC